MPNKSTLTILREARALIADPVRWTPFRRSCHSAFNAEGYGVSPLSSRAIQFNAFGALCKVLNLENMDDRATQHEAYSMLKRFCTIEANQHHEKALEMFDRAIAAEEAKERA